MLDLFSGIGGFSLAASWTGGIETVAFCEIEPYCQKVLHKHWPDVPIYPDIKQLRGEDIGSVDIVCGGFPCQPFSSAGKRKGKEDDRYLWPEMLRVIKELRPTWVLGENVANFVNMALDETITNLENEAYETRAFIIPACAIDAPHQRKRVFIVAHSKSSTEHNEIIWEGNHLCNSKEIVWGGFNSSGARVADGISNRVDRLKGLGNAIVPQVVYPILQGIVDIENNQGRKLRGGAPRRA